MQFTDAPYHKAFEIATTDGQINELADVGWSYKNVALLEPNMDGTDWAISTFEIEEHGISEGSDAVLYSGRVTARSANFPGVRDSSFPCQLFVDTVGDSDAGWSHMSGPWNRPCALYDQPEGWMDGATFPVPENPYYYDYHYHWDACLDGAPNGCSCDYEDGLKCRTYGSGAWYQSRCCYCDEQIIGGKCVKCTETDGDCTADC